MNPYDFVPLPARVLQEAPVPREKVGQHCSLIRCRVTAITPIFIAATQAAGGTHRFIRSRYAEKDLPIIPGSSLKGVIRSIAEAVTESCIGLSGTLFSRRGQIEPDYRGKVDKAFEPCKSAKKLCPACRLFGMVSNQSHFLGKVTFGEGRTAPDQFKESPQIVLKPLMPPHPDHDAFYLRNGRIAGRKFYFHQSTVKSTIQPTEFTKTIYPLQGLGPDGKPQTIFDFEVQSQNLTDYEYSVLVFSLFLTDGMRHKLGTGKPLGLGSVSIEPLMIRPHDQSRYRGLSKRTDSAAPGGVLTGEALKSHLEQTMRPLIERRDPCMTELRRILKYPPATGKNGEPINYQYPERTWFDTHSQTPLAETP